MKIIQRRRLPKTAYTAENTEKELIIVHWIVGNKHTGFRAFERKGSRKSSHYIVSYDGKVYQLADEKHITYHAGYSILPGYSTRGPLNGKIVNWNSLNPCSIGIEIAGPPSINNRNYERVNKKPVMTNGWPKRELEALAELCVDIAGRWPGIRITDHSSVVAVFKPGVGFLRDENGNYIRRGKIDVKKGTGKEIDIFPWDWLLEKTGIEEA